jgi:WD40 repeat protein/serine/threonine protein kinase
MGSYGEVWLARNVMGRYRAAKFIFRKTFRDAHPFQRELAGIQQFEPVSRSHPGFVHILHVGRNDAEEYFYYLMEAADDIQTGQQINPAKYTPRTLSTEISRAGRLPVTEAVRFAKHLAGALAHLHEKGLVHRDIKPSNIVFVDNTAKFADIGLVTSIADARSYVGTEGFIPPEGPGSAQADIYSLGKVLYEAATGKDRQQFPELPANFADGEEAARFLELNEVILKACDPEASRRYQSAREMLAELELLDAGKSVRQARRRAALVKRSRRLALAAVICAAIFAAIYYPMRSQRADSAVHQREAVHGELTRADAAMRAGSYLDALPFYFRALRLDAGDPVRTESHRLRIGCVIASAPRLTKMWFLPGPGRRVEISRDGTRVLLVEDKIEIKEIDSGKTLCPLFAPPLLRDACLSPDGEHVLTSGGDGAVVLWDFSGREILHLQHEGEVCSVRFSPDGSRVVAACADGTAYIWNVATKKVEHTLRGHTGRVNRAVFSPNGEFVATADTGGRAFLWDAKTGARVGAEMPHGAAINDLVFSPDGKRLATACEDGSARLWRVPGGEDTAGVMRHQAPVRSIAFSPDGKLILTASHDSRAHLWQAALGVPATENPTLPNSGRLSWGCFDSSNRIALASLDGSVRLWTFPAKTVFQESNGLDIAHLTNPPAIGKELAGEGAQKLSGSYVNGQRQRVLTVGAQKTFRIWDSQDGEPATPLISYSQNLSAIYFLADAASVLGIDADGKRAWLWHGPVDDHSMEELRLLCGLLANDWIDLTADRVEIERAWNQMQQRDPKLFQP